MFSIKAIIFYLLFWYLIRSSMANDFCETFAKNNFSIDYGIYNHIRIEPMFEQKGWLVIEDNIWGFEVNKNNGSIDLVTNGSAIPLGLTKEAKMVFIGFHGNIGLIDKNDSIHMTSLGTTMRQQIISKSKLNSIIHYIGVTYPSVLVFNINNHSMIIGFVEQNYNSSVNQFEKDMTFYHIKKDNINKLDFDPDSFGITKTIYNFDKSIEIMAIFGPYIMENQLISNPIQISLRSFDSLHQPLSPQPLKQRGGPIFESFRLTYEYLILIKVNKSIQYFFTSDNITNQYKTLIDCRHWPISVGNFDSEKHTEESYITGSAVTDILVSFITTTAVLLILMVPLWIGYKRWAKRLRQLPQSCALPVSTNESSNEHKFSEDITVL